MAIKPPSFWRTAWVVFRKEILDSRRDRRTLMSALFGSLLTPLLLFGQFRMFDDKFEDAQDISLAVVHGEQMPALLDGLRDRGINIIDAPADPRAAVESGELPFVLQLDQDFARQWKNTGGGSMELLYGDLETTDTVRMESVKDRLQEISQEIAIGRLTNRGIAVSLLRPLQMKEERLVGENARPNQILGMFGFVLMMSAFVSTMYVSIDATAGERERQSLEPILLTGTKPKALLAGKSLSVAVVGLLVMTLGWIGSMMAWAASEGGMVSTPFSLQAAVLGFLGFLGAIPLIICMQLLVYTYARSFREAQVYASFLMLAPTMTGFFLQLAEVDSTSLLMLPLIGQQLFVGRCISGNLTGLPELAVGTVISLLLAVVCWLATARLLSQEKIVYARSE